MTTRLQSRRVQVRPNDVGEDGVHSDGTSVRVVVAAAADPGQGGIGAAARDIADGFILAGADVTYLRHDAQAPWARLAGTTVLRRFRAMQRQITGAAIARRAQRCHGLAYVMPLCMPGGGPATILHHATHYPRIARAVVSQVRRDTGGGATFIGRHELAVLEQGIARADLIRVESELVRDQLLDAGVPDERIVLASPGVDVDRFKPGVPEPTPLVAYVGALSLWKGLDVLAELSRSLAARDMGLEIIGGPVCRWSRRTAEPLVRAAATSVPELLARAHALVLPSVADGFGYVVLEAMASGAVPFVTPAVGAAELVRQIDPSLVIERVDFVDAVPELLATLPIQDLAARARTIAERYERTAMAGHAARELLDAAGRRGLIPVG